MREHFYHTSPEGTMSVVAIILSPALARAAVIGAFGGAGLALTAVYSRRGPMIYPVYAAILAALAVLLSRYSALPFLVRACAALTGFCVATAAAYVTVGILAGRQRRLLVAQGRLPAAALHARLSIAGHAWRIGALLTIGTIASAGVAFIAV
jgi:hypothetical protein